jgi:hypothetical protein
VLKGVRLGRLGRLQGGPFEIELDRTALVGQGEKGKLAHHAPSHHPPGDGHQLLPLGALG